MLSGPGPGSMRREDGALNVGGADPEELSDREAALAPPPRAAPSPAQEMTPPPADKAVPSPIIPAAYERLHRRLPTSRRGRLIAAVLVLGLALIPSLALLILPVWLDLDEEDLKGLGYVGIFVANLVSTATVFLPVPGLTAAGQALIIYGGETLNPVVAGLLGGAGMALGGVTGYVAGTVGGGMARGRHVGGAPRGGGGGGGGGGDMRSGVREGIGRSPHGRSAVVAIHFEPARAG